MTYDQLERALACLREWNSEIKEINGRNYDPMGHDADRLKEIDELKKWEISE